jgi:hypothetical protein
MISQERFTELMHNALKKRKISKPQRDLIINRDWFLVESDNAEPDSIIEHEENLTRIYLAAQKKAKAVPLESDEQQAFVAWFRDNFDHALIFANANGGHRDIRTAVTLKKEGVLAGVADLTILWCDGKTTWVEMKRKKGGVQSDEQKNFQKFVTERGDKYLLCYGFEDAKKQILEL